jgi:hypothetical protein
MNKQSRFGDLLCIRLKTRFVHIAGLTTAPNGAYMKQVARNLTDVSDGFLANSRHLILDRDTNIVKRPENKDSVFAPYAVAPAPGAS